jgi:hypothetical protein
VLRPRAVRDVAGAEVVQDRHDGLQVAQRLAQESEDAQLHDLLLAQVDSREQRLHRRGGSEQPA